MTVREPIKPNKIVDGSPFSPHRTHRAPQSPKNPDDPRNPRKKHCETVNLKDGPLPQSVLSASSASQQKISVPLRALQEAISFAIINHKSTIINPNTSPITFGLMKELSNEIK